MLSRILDLQPLFLLGHQFRINILQLYFKLLIPDHQLHFLLFSYITSEQTLRLECVRIFKLLWFDLPDRPWRVDFNYIFNVYYPRNPITTAFVDFCRHHILRYLGASNCSIGPSRPQQWSFQKIYFGHHHLSNDECHLWVTSLQDCILSYSMQIFWVARKMFWRWNHDVSSCQTAAYRLTVLIDLARDQPGSGFSSSSFIFKPL